MSNRIDCGKDEAIHYLRNMNNLITISPDVQSGTPVFCNTRVPIKNLFDYLKAGDSLDVFLDDFPSVSREQAIGLLQLVENTLTFNSTTHHDPAFA